MHIFFVTGRIILEPISSNKCLTVTNPSSSGPYYVKAEKCTSNTKPSAAQTWGFGNDFGDVIFYVRLLLPEHITPLNQHSNTELTLPFISKTGSQACSGGAGVSMKNNGEPKLASGDRVELSCEGTFESFTLTKKKN